MEEGTGAARVRSTGSATISSGYQLLWFAAAPGGQGNTAGSPGFFIANTTPTDLTSTLSTIRTRVWRFPLVSAPGISANGIPYTGRRFAENGQFSAVYADIPTVVAANGDRLDFTIVWTQAGPSAAQQTAQMMSVITDTGASLVSLGDLQLYAPFTPT